MTSASDLDLDRARDDHSKKLSWKIRANICLIHGAFLLTERAFSIAGNCSLRLKRWASISSLKKDYTPFEDDGFLPFLLEGEDGQGVEIQHSELTKNSVYLHMFADISAGRDHCIAMTWGSSMADCPCAMIVSYPLAKEFDAIASYEHEKPGTLEDMLSDAHEALEYATKEKASTPIQAPTSMFPDKKSPWWKLW